MANTNLMCRMRFEPLNLVSKDRNSVRQITQSWTEDSLKKLREKKRMLERRIAMCMCVHIKEKHK